ncbi:MAG: SCP2 sterol-binding domain-containing protein [Actinobacteria bacterium]|nr:SCP2 sterol-binding domain-containing protein [Actinomycetota bacterium]
MVLQYLEQDLAEFEHKAQAARRVRCTIGMQVQGTPTAITVSFLGDRIVVENGIAGRPDLVFKGPYMLLADILCGRANPFAACLRGRLRFLSVPRRPFQALKVLRLLKVAPQGVLERAPEGKGRLVVAGCVVVALLSMVYFVMTR